MPLRIFITGATGYIGGQCLQTIYSRHPEYNYYLLTRNEDKADIVKKAYPSVNTVIGDLESDSVLKEQAAKADVVLHTADASDNEGAANAIAAGLVSGHSKDRPGFWLHTGGSGILTYKDSDADRLGEYTDEEYNDWERVQELTGLPDHAFHRNVDKIVLETAAKHGDAVKTALLCPPTIYGKGKGPVATRSRQAYELAKLILQSEYIPIVGGGKARWNNVHVQDLSDLFLLLTEAAEARKLDKGLWGENGYYLVENGEHYWSHLAESMGAEAEKLGFVKGKLEKKSLSKDAAIDQAGFEAVSWGWNSRGKAERARKQLGWSPSAPSIEQEIPNILRDEHGRLSNAQ